ncbi:MAG: glycosyltransferase family 9 protein [Magnetovibrionaceae bacterium]
MRLLFISSTRVGDAILSTGLLNHLISENPGLKVTVACGPAAVGLFSAVPGLERLIRLDKMAFSLHWPSLWAACVARRWDLLVDLRNSPMFYVLSAKQKWRIGRIKSPDHRVVQLASILGLEDNPPAPRLWVDEGRTEAAKMLIPDGAPVLAVGPTANWRAKQWRPEHFAGLIEKLTAPGGILAGGRVAVFGRDDERPSALRLIEALPKERCLDLVGTLDLLTVYACLERSAFYVGNDSGLMHLAAASGIPTLGLFGPSPINHYAPWGPCTGVASTAVPYEEIFPENFNHRTSDTLMDSLTVEMAAEAAEELWGRVQAAA